MKSVSENYVALQEESLNAKDLLEEADRRLSLCGYKLYKYCSDNEDNIQDFAEQKIFFNSLDNLNDPFEYSLFCDEEVLLDFFLEQTDQKGTARSLLNQLAEIKPFLKIYPTLSEGRKRSLIKESFASVSEDAGLSPMVIKPFLDLFSQEKVVNNRILCGDILVAMGKFEDKKMIEDSLKNGKNLFEREFRDRFKSRFQISCFSEIPDSILMWSHYANKHKGFVLAYDFKDALKKDSLPQYVNEYVTLFPVTYVDKAAPVSPEMLQVNNPAHQAKALGDFAEVLYRKNKVWSYEKEWRGCTPAQDPIAHVFLKPSSIIFGSLCPAETKARLADIAKTLGVKCFEMQANRASYHLDQAPYFL